MILEKLELTRNTMSIIYRGASTGEYYGTLQFVGDNGAIAININNELAKKIIAICAEQLVETTKGVAESMTAEIIQQTSENLIEDQRET